MTLASNESRLIRSTFVKSSGVVDIPLVLQRQQWEAAVAQFPLPPGITVEPTPAGGVPCEWISPEGAIENRALLYIHGGGFTAGSCITHRELAARIALATQRRVLLAAYRLAPEFPFPAALEDIVCAYCWLMEQGYGPEQLAIGGDSAGGGLVVSALLLFRERKLPMPGSAILLSPWLDLSLSGESIMTRSELDPLTTEAGLRVSAELYAGEQDRTLPLISPVYGDLSDLPPMLIEVGDHEILLSDSVRLAEKSPTVTLHVWQEMWHVFPAWAAGLPEGQEALEEIGRFVKGEG